MTTSNPNTNSNRNLCLHLTDSSLIPLLSSSTSTSAAQPTSSPSPQAASLTALTSTALSAYDASLRFNYGLPERIIIESESSGPILLHSFLNPSSPSSSKPSNRRRAPNSDLLNGLSSIRGREILSAAREEMRPLSGTTEGSRNHSPTQNDNQEEEAHSEEVKESLALLLVGTVVVRSANEMNEARKAAQKVEKVGKQFQREWSRGKEITGERDANAVVGEG
ncbi:hypothetical protein CJF31_00005369 [Rutstroemia sp. NJR-2017a BVV2]|nr:hypothetical protein CJF31_00005369 [Rutstroemia sp. NJR-2017a BVV2]